MLFHTYAVLLFFQNLGTFFSAHVGFLLELMCNLFKLSLHREEAGWQAMHWRTAVGCDLVFPTGVVLFAYAWERLTGLIYDATSHPPFRRLRATFLLALTRAPEPGSKHPVVPSEATAHWIDVGYVGAVLFCPGLLTAAQQAGLLGGRFKDGDLVTHLLYNTCACSAAVLAAFLVADLSVHVRLSSANSYLGGSEFWYPRFFEAPSRAFSPIPGEHTPEASPRLGPLALWLGGACACMALHCSPWWLHPVSSVALKLLRVAAIYYQSVSLFGVLQKRVPKRFVAICALWVLVALLLITMFDQRRPLDQGMLSGSTIVQGLLEAQPGGDVLDYPVCDARWGGHPSGGSFTALDAALAANLAYVHDELELLGNVSAVFKHHPLGVPAVREVQPWQTVGRWVAMEFEAEVDVLSFRGSGTTLDFVTDMELWFRVKTMLLADAVLPFISTLPLEVKRRMIHGDGGWMVRFLGLEQPWAAPCAAAAKAKARADARGRVLVIVGHSLGGGLASICAAHLSVPGVMLSPPGGSLSAHRFNVDTEARHLSAKKLVTIVPDFDIVPTADEHLGTVQRIGCHAEDPAACHSAERTLCELWHACGDLHSRDLTKLCNNYLKH